MHMKKKEPRQRILREYLGSISYIGHNCHHKCNVHTASAFVFSFCLKVGSCPPDELMFTRIYKPSKRGAAQGPPPYK